jgi:hypothetical protein
MVNSLFLRWDIHLLLHRLWSSLFSALQILRLTPAATFGFQAFELRLNFTTSFPGLHLADGTWQDLSAPTVVWDYSHNECPHLSGYRCIHLATIGLFLWRTPIHFFFFWDGVSLRSPSWPSTQNPPTSTSQVAQIINSHHCAKLK